MTSGIAETLVTSTLGWSYVHVWAYPFGLLRNSSGQGSIGINLVGLASGCVSMMTVPLFQGSPCYVASCHLVALPLSVPSIDRTPTGEEQMALRIYSPLATEEALLYGTISHSLHAPFEPFEPCELPIRPGLSATSSPTRGQRFHPRLETIKVTTLMQSLTFPALGLLSPQSTQNII